ncbi:MAG: hypothetical protein MJ233_05455 [Mycoplasmoidaceae bacterium]|nr:hypothetical protein [Mycoplasmoidaceae bacterium]
MPLHKNMIVVNNTTTYKDVNEILVKEGKTKVLDILNSPNNPRFVTYYITHTLKNITNLNLDSKVKDVLKVIKTENNPAHFDSYISLISSITKLAASDLKRTYDLIRGESGFEATSAKQKSTRVVYPPVVNNMIDAYRRLITLLLADPTLAEDSYSEFENKSPDKIKISELQDYIYFIKTLAITSFAPTDLIAQENKLVDTLFKSKKIGEVSFKFIKDMIADIQSNSEYSITIHSNKSKCVSLVEHINACYDEIILGQLKHDVANNKYKGEQLAEVNKEIIRLNNKINHYKRHKKTKYHIA